MTSLLVLALLSVDAPACPVELFRIERSKNANVVLYEAKAGPAGELDGAEPVTASWLLLAEHGQREPLSFFERKMAYGFDVRAGPDGFALRIKALANRSIVVRRVGACPAALATIGGREGVLRRIYVQADDSGLVPRVQYVEVFGVDAATGEALYEKLAP